jgi:replicative DNA helicase
MANALLPPTNLEAEEYVLGAMMLSPRAIDAVLNDVGLLPDDFYRGSHGKIFEAITALYVESNAVDPLTVVDKLIERGALKGIGPDRIREIATCVPAAANASHHAAIVRRCSVLRATINAGVRIQQLGQDAEGDLPEILDRVEGLVFELARNRRKNDFVTIEETVAETLRRTEEVQAAGHAVVGVPFGFEALDGLTSGLHPGNLVIVAGRPSMGKTGLGLCIAANVAMRAKLPVAIFTLEMNRAEVTQRLLSSEGLVESQKIRNGHLSVDEWGRLAAAGSRLRDATILIDDTADLTAIELRSKARKLRLRNPDLALIVVDYIQLMTSGIRSDSRVQDVSQTSRALKVLAAELQIPVLALSQLSRAVEQRHDHRPMLSDLRESGAIEQDADVVAFIYRDEYYNPEDTDQQGLAEVDIAKHRNGPTSMVKLSFVKRYVRFSDLPRPGAGDPV